MRKPQSDGVRSRERLMPALLDRLTDAQPTQRSEADMPGQGSAALRTAVLRDLGWLLNATSLAAGVDLSRFHEARRSVLNYGVLPLAGKRVSELDCQELANGIRLAILHYEPRLLPDSVEVACVSHLDTLALRNELAFEIRARLWAQPYPLAFMVRSELDLESGHTVLRDLVEG